MYPEYIMRNVRANLGYEGSDKTHDKEITSMPKSEVLERYFTWKGICNYGETIRCAVSDIYNVKLIG